MSAATRHCPVCGGEVHLIAGQCKHCKADLSMLPATTPATLPAAAPAHVLVPVPAAAVAAVHSPAPMPRPGSSWSQRWPLLVLALALLAIGFSLGVLVERWRGTSTEVRSRPPGNTPHIVPDRMPRQ